MNAPFKNLIAGEWAGSQNASRNINPSNTNDVVGEYSQGSVEDLNNAVAAAKAAFPAWSRTTPQERYEILKKASDEILARKDELGRLLSREEGKTLLKELGIEGDYEGIDHLVVGYAAKPAAPPLPRKKDYIRWA